ncbi:hypothetical protein I79_008422 [Cricetulus griseus]|uniref:Uncharacterized protein n=1 Tax=Cricetulus griseus TaxID=10029 RepID=G3HD48_CRIGR|nr:hypothetical protein I79_008422 [Cricetulus griseus]
MGVAQKGWAASHSLSLFKFIVKVNSAADHSGSPVTHAAPLWAPRAVLIVAILAP